MDLFVYYDVRPEHAEAVRARVLALQAALPCRGRLMRRPDGDDRPTTWMEVYEGVDDGFEARLAAAVERHGVAALTGPRHVERFVEVD